MAVFDFDGTLVEGDSLIPFLTRVAGRGRTMAALVESSLRMHQPDPAMDRRTRFKAYLMRRLLAGRRVADVQEAVTALRRWLRWKDATVAALRDHHAKGHRIVIASGGLDLYLPTLLADLPCDALLCTRAEVRDGVLTGGMPDGNCVRLRKAALVAAWLDTHGPFDERWGYGNAPHDLPMLGLMTHRTVV